jgi:hypothetical protein
VRSIPTAYTASDRLPQQCVLKVLLQPHRRETQQKLQLPKKTFSSSGVKTPDRVGRCRGLFTKLAQRTKSDGEGIRKRPLKIYGVGVDGVVGDQMWSVSLHAISATFRRGGLNFLAA